MQDQEIKVQNFLGNFSHPVVIRKELRTHNKKTDKFSIPIMLEKNKQTCEQLLFTPNGAFGIKTNNKKKIVIAKENRTAPMMSSLVIKEIKINDIDLLITALKFHGIEPSFIIKTDEYCYVLINIKEGDRLNVNGKYSLIALKNLLKTIVHTFLSFNYIAIDNLSMELIPLPYSEYRIETPSGLESKTVILEELGGILTLENINSLIEYTKDVNLFNKYSKFLLKEFGTEGVNKLNNTSLSDIKELIKLVDIPITFGGNDGEEMLYDGSSCGCLYNNNTINCLYTSFKPMASLPRGILSIFLYILFNKNIRDLQSYYYKICGYDLYKNSIDKNITLKKDVKRISTDDYTIEFLGSKVVVETMVGGNVTRRILFRRGITILGKGYHNVKYNGFTLDRKTRILLIEIDGEKMIMECIESKSKFNVKYKDICFFYGSDNQLGMFFDLVYDRDEVKQLSLIIDNGIYSDRVVLGGQVLVGKPEDDDTMILCESKYSLSTDSEQIDYKEYLKKMQGLYSDVVVIPVLLQTIALAGMNLRTDGEVFPGILLTGQTGSGKSALATMVKRMIGYSSSSRKRGLPALTAQPLSLLGSDPSVLFLEELTMNVSSKTEELLRNVLNRDTGERGNLSSNVQYDFRSPLFVTGERTFKDESLNNRFVAINMSQLYWKDGGKDLIYEIEKLTCYESVYNKYLEIDIEELNNKKKYYADKLSKVYESRNADVRSFIYTINNLFGFGFTESRLDNIMKENLSLLGFEQGVKKEINFEKDFTSLLIRGIYGGSALFMEEEDEKNDIDIYTLLFYDDVELEKNRIKNRFLVKELNTKYNGKNISFNGDSIVVKIHQKNVNDYDIALNNIITNVKKTKGSRYR